MCLCVFSQKVVDDDSHGRKSSPAPCPPDSKLSDSVLEKKVPSKVLHNFTTTVHLMQVRLLDGDLGIAPGQLFSI